MTTKVLLDTDIGTDIDDAVCLAYLLANPECELMGITTVSAEPIKRAQMASVLCKVAGRDIPIFPGAAKPLLVPQIFTEAKQKSALSKWDHEKKFPDGEAVRFMRETIRQNPGEITLLTIGPLTNIALLFSMDPEIPSLLKSLVMMCGVFTNRLPKVGPREYNALCDPHAAAIVYQQTMNIHRSIGLDVTCQVIMEAPEVKKRFQSPLLAPVLDFADVWFEQVSHIIFHDPLAGATIFDDKICEFKKGLVEIELTSEKVLGMTHWTREEWLPEGKTAQHEMALKVDPERFYDHYFSFFD